MSSPSHAAISLAAPLALTSLLVISVTTTAQAAPAPATARTLSGANNNVAHPSYGQAGTNYLRVAAPNYSDHISAAQTGPAARMLSNRIFNDTGQNIFSERGISQWGWTWAQFIDHDMGLRNETPDTATLPNPYAPPSQDPLERFIATVDDLGFHRTPAAPPTTTAAPRQQVNTVSSFLDASQIYGTTAARSTWLRDSTGGLRLPGNLLPRADSLASPPAMDLFGAQIGNPGSAVVAGDVRANENVALTAVQTLFAREHNRLVGLLPNTLTAEQKFQTARRVVGAEIAYITYSEFLPAMGVSLPSYSGYKPAVNPGLANEFATTLFRGHSMVHGEFELVVPATSLSDDAQATLVAQGVTITLVPDPNGRDTLEVVVPLVVAFGNPHLLDTLGVSAFLNSLSETEYRNDEQIDESLRSVLFQVPKPGADPALCGEEPDTDNCFSEISDLGAIDVLRARDHGMPNYNDMRAAYGLPRYTTFRAITGESTQSLPAGTTINSPSILDFTRLVNAAGEVVDPGSEEAQETVVIGTRRSTLAARLASVFGNVNSIDAFTGSFSEKHVTGSELGQLERTAWTKQFTALRNGDRYFYLNDPQLTTIRTSYHLDYRTTLAQVVANNAGTALSPTLFHAVG